MDEWSDAEIRPLKFPLRDSEVIETETPDDAIVSGVFVWPSDPDEKTVVLFELSQREYTALASTIDVGRDIAFGEDSTKLWWLWIRNMVQVPEICSMVAECFASDTGFRASVVNSLKSDPGFMQAIQDISAGNVLTGTARGQNLLKPDACGEGFIFNQTSVFVTLLNDLSTDVLQAIEAETNGLERAEALVSAIPVIGGLFPVDELIGLADQVAEEVWEGYEGDWDEGLYDDLRCAMFCLFKDDCAVSIDDAIAFYEEKLGESLPSDPVEMFVALLQYIVTGSFPENAAVYVMHLLCLSGIRLSQNILGVDFGKMGLRVIAAGDEQDNDWETLCLDCAPPYEGLWEIYTTYPGVGPDAAGEITAQSPTSASFATTSGAGGEYRIIAQYDAFGGPVTIVTSSDPGAILAKYHGNGTSIFGGSYENDQMTAGDLVNYFYFTSTSPFTLTITFTV